MGLHTITIDPPWRVSGRICSDDRSRGAMRRSPPSGELVDPRSLARGQGGLYRRLGRARVGIGGLRLRRLPLNELRRFHDERWYDTRNTHGNILYQVDPCSDPWA